MNINNDPTALWTIPVFQAVLTHEIGHALGLGDVGLNGVGNLFRDDNFDDFTTATVVGTLTNSWAVLIDPLDPENDSDVNLYSIPFATFDSGSGDAPNLVM